MKTHCHSTGGERSTHDHARLHVELTRFRNRRGVEEVWEQVWTKREGIVCFVSVVVFSIFLNFCSVEFLELRREVERVKDENQTLREVNERLLDDAEVRDCELYEMEKKLEELEEILFNRRMMYEGVVLGNGVDFDLTTRSGFTPTCFRTVFQRIGPAMVGTEDMFLKAEELFGMNAVAAVALAGHEGAFWTSDLARKRNNPFGWNAVDGRTSLASRFSSRDHAIRFVVDQISKLYLSEDGKFFTDEGPTFRGMGRNYATDPGWAYKMALMMKRIVSELVSEDDYEKMVDYEVYERRGVG